MVLDKKKAALKYSSKPKISVELVCKLKSREDLALAYTPGIAEVSKLVAKKPEAMFTHTFRRNNLAVISDGSAVLGLGNIGHKASYPVMEGKAMLFKRFGGIDAIPLIIDTQDEDKFVETVCHIADSFAAINLEDISAPRCFSIERRLKKALSIPVMHDDQHGAAVVVLAAVLNSLKLVPHKDKRTKIVIVGAGAAGIGIAKLLLASGFKRLVMLDSKGILSTARADLKAEKLEIAKQSKLGDLEGGLEEAMEGAGVFIGVSKGGLLRKREIGMMAKDPIVLAMANPVPEIFPRDAKQAGAAIVGTGRSDYANQVNNALAFPAIFKAAIKMRRQIDQEMLVAASSAIVEYHKPKLARDCILPSILDKGVHSYVSRKLVNSFS